MFGIDDAIIGGGITAVGGIVNNLLNKSGQKDAEKFNAEQAQKQMDFQERMSSTAYQRSMADMRAAGLNPILAYQKGGASSPSGSAGSAVYQGMQDAVGPAVSTAMQGRRLNAEVANMAATNELIRAQTAQAGSQTMSINADTALKVANLATAKAEAVKAGTAEGWYSSPLGKALQIMGITGKELNPFGSMFGR